ncbi:MAG: hypothetical protein AVDCRST_MAG07-1051, partial [uncultured Frankineae bacterium]
DATHRRPCSARRAGGQRARAPRRGHPPGPRVHRRPVRRDARPRRQAAEPVDDAQARGPTPGAVVSTGRRRSRERRRRRRPPDRADRAV